MVNYKRMGLKVLKKNIKFFMINKILRLALLCLCIVLLSVSVFSLYRTEKFGKYTVKKSPVYSYDNTAKVNYQVNLLDNPLYPEKKLKEGQTCYSNFVNNIDTLFTYEFHGERAATVKGSYNIHAVLEGYESGDKGDKTLWKKDYELQPDTNFEGVSVQKLMPITTKQYSDYANKVFQAAGVSSSIKLTFMWNVSAEIQTDKGTKNENLTCTMNVPLGAKMLEIKGNLVQSNKGSIEETVKVISTSYKKQLMLYSILLVFSLIFITFIFLFTTPKAAMDPVEKKRKHIFKEHGSRMVALYSEIDTSSKPIIQVLSIDDLVKVADDIGRPILYKGSEEISEIYNFYVLDDKNIYILDIHR